MGEKCEKCDPSTVPDKAFVFENWNIVPGELHESCISFASSKYNEKTYEPHREKTGFFAYAKTKTQISFVSR